MACQLGGRAASDIAEFTFKKAFRDSRFTSQGKSKQWLLVPSHRTPLSVLSKVFTPIGAEMASSVDHQDGEVEEETDARQAKRQRTSAPDSNSSASANAAM